ncbi:outer membrane protein assembly factor BamB family protein [Roseimaritima sediminicola]|uniref:outer membrane protein assembly factor BamB family protein n=1 Tax=Roseimaritima sediminicola TaxID=2662066 RepID=UPI001F40AE26|nr:PQQ-binding-like beta-propeller repeat protein [Roseimaritima sediminicola]
MSADHRVALHGNGRLVILDTGGAIEWQRPWGPIHDLHVLDNGNLMVQQGKAAVVEIDRESKQVVWKYDAAGAEGEQSGPVEIHGFQPLDDGTVMIAESGRRRIIEVDRQGRIVHTVPLVVENPHPHTDTRLARKLASGHYLVCHEADGTVREYDAAGHIVWQYRVPLFDREPAPGHGPDAFGNKVFSALRLAGGNTLIGTGNGHSVLEVDPEGQIVWQIRQHDLPGITLAWVTTVQVLANGNRVIGNCHAGPGQPLLIEVEPETKRVVWTLDRFDTFGNNVSNCLILEDDAETDPPKSADAAQSAEGAGPLAGAFTPPPKYRDRYGDYRSPLRFADGSRVRTAEDWQRRRAEILKLWQEKLGAWPPLMEDQQLEILETTREEGLSVHRVGLQWTPENRTEGYLLVPEGPGPHPAVITVYYEPETAIGQGKPYRDFALQLARRGFVTLSLGTSEATASKTYALFHPHIDRATVQPLSMLGYAAANAWHALANRPEVDSQRIGIVGHSFGGKWAMFASCLFDKFACAAWSDPGIVFDESRPSVNYWEPYYLGYHPRPWRKRGMITKENPARGLYPQLVAEGRDLHELHALMAPRPFLVSGGSEDPPERWLALNHTIAVNRLLGYEDRVAMTNRPEHSPNAQSNAAIYAFFERFLIEPVGR